MVEPLLRIERDAKDEFELWDLLADSGLSAVDPSAARVKERDSTTARSSAANQCLAWRAYPNIH